MPAANRPDLQPARAVARFTLHSAASVLCGIALVAAMLAGCNTADDPDDGATGTSTVDMAPTDFGVPVEHADLCKFLGSDSITQLATQYGYEPGSPEQTAPGTCAQYPTRLEGDLEKETITVLSTADIWTSVEAAEAAFRHWNDPDSNSYRLRLAFPESEQQSELGGDWDQAVMVADPEWDHGPQFKVMARVERVIVFYHITLSLNGSEVFCSVEQKTDCVIPPEIVADWIESELLPEVLSNLVEAGLLAD
jgi:hypothetical protein